MKNAVPSPRSKIGRPLSFDPATALIPAMMLFWRHGYEGTSLSALTRAMGVTPPSIYAVYGDKKRLFQAAVHAYLNQAQTPFAVIAQAPTAKAAAQALIDGSVIAFTGPDTPPGCLLASSAIAVSAEAEDVRQDLAKIRQAIEAALGARIAADVAQAELPAQTDPDILAAYVMTIIQGLSTLARDGADRTKLARVGQLAMTAWP